MATKLTVRTSINIKEDGVEQLHEFVKTTQVLHPGRAEFQLEQRISFSLTWHDRLVASGVATRCEVVLERGTTLTLYILTGPNGATKKSNQPRDTSRVFVDATRIIVPGQPDEVRGMYVDFTDGDRVKVMPENRNQLRSATHIPRLG